MISASLFMLSILVFVNLYLIFLVKNIAAGDLIYMNILAVMAILIFSGTSYVKQSSFRKLKRKLCEDPDEEAGILLDDFENQDLLEHDRAVFEKRLRQEKERTYDLENAMVNQVHEIKLPLTSLYLLQEEQVSMIEQAESKNTDPDFLLNLQKINQDENRELDRLNRLLNVMLDSNRISSELTEIRIRKTMLNKVIHQAVRENAVRLIRGGFQIDLSEDEITAYTDEHWIRFVLNQLIENSLKYRTDKRTGKIRIELSKDRNAVILVFEDNGQGILPEDLPTIFEKGFTGQNQTSQKVKSTGMGLYFSRMILQKLDCSIEAFSIPDELTRFTIRIPVNETETIRLDRNPNAALPV